ncbi:MAK10-like protein, partial [Tanacetum coccineum]
GPLTPFLTLVVSTPLKEPEQNPETSMDKVQKPSSESTAQVPPPEDHDSIFIEILKPKAKKIVQEPNSPEPDSYQPKLPYPERMKVREKDKPSAQHSWFLKMFKQLRLEIGLKDALVEMPKFNKWLSGLLRNKEKLEEIAITTVYAECSAIILNKVLKKLEDPGKFLIPCALQELDRTNTLADSGASINLLPHSIYKQLGLGALTPTRMKLEIANRSITHPMGIPEDVVVRVDGFTFLADFVVVNFVPDPRVPIILGRHFLRTVIRSIRIEKLHLSHWISCVLLLNFISTIELSLSLKKLRIAKVSWQHVTWGEASGGEGKVLSPVFLRYEAIIPSTGATVFAFDMRYCQGDYFKPSHEGYRNTIELPAGNNMVPLRSDTIRLVQNGCSFHGLRSEDPNQHLKDFLKLVDSLDLFGGSISSWEGSTTRFTCSILPTGKDAKLRNDSMFQLNFMEKLYLKHGTHPFPRISKIRTIDQSAGGKLHDLNAEESWALLEDLALYDNESWNDPRDFVRPVKAITLPQDVPSTSDRRLIELKNQVQRLMEAHLALTQPTQTDFRIHGILRRRLSSLRADFKRHKMEDEEVMFIEIIRYDDEPQNESLNEGEGTTTEGPTIMRRKLNPREDANGGISNFIGRIKGMHVFIGNFTYVVDFMIVEDISSIIDPRLSQVVLGRPFIEISNMTHDLPEGVVRFANGDDEVAYKMPHKIEQYNSLSNLEKEHTKFSLY